MTEITYAPTRVWKEEEPPVGAWGTPIPPLVQTTQFRGSAFGPLLGGAQAHLPNLELIAVIDLLMARLEKSVGATAAHEDSRAVNEIHAAATRWREAVEYWGWLSAYKMDRGL
jgi:hypothetical protein